MGKRGLWALFAALLLGISPARAGDEVNALLKSPRAWRGVVEVESSLQTAKFLAGDEIQRERVEFVVLTDPARTAGADHMLKLRLARAKGNWSLKIDLRDSRGASEISTKGAASGALNFVVDGIIDVARGEVRLRFGTRGQRMLAKTTSSGVSGAGFATFRNVATRRSILEGLVETGSLDARRAKAEGAREFVLKRGRYTRKVRIRWSLEHLEPVVRGRILDQHGQPVAGLVVIARTLSPAGPGRVASTLRLEAKSGPDGRFRIPARIGTWGIEVQGRLVNGVLTRGWVKSDAVRLRFDHVPNLSIEAVAYAYPKLPRTRLLARHFRSDVNVYMAYIERRHTKAQLALARLPAKKE